ncbi:RWD domain-containing protein [Giardia muris]|uniref:RWD domain-containing protein n=1 Tax=Giardia muris TaxID=5742 RepID=A0A4Z1SQN5_GIAMU|nr:RWD domain-containing protein [Giardia muris]|eukprot:TNJ28146.1 RWD domain-containing protein [Giardia muris]
MAAEAEAQAYELEAIRMMYPEDLEELGPTEYRFNLPIPSVNNAYLRLHIAYPTDYPASPLKLMACEPHGLGENLATRIIHHLEVTHSTLVGEPYVLMLTSLLEDIIGDTTLTTTDPSIVLEAIPEKSEENLEIGLIPGPPLTPESFANWWPSFSRENNLVADWRVSDDGRPSGREIWLEKLKNDDYRDGD